MSGDLWSNETNYEQWKRDEERRTAQRINFFVLLAFFLAALTASLWFGL